MFYSVSQKTHKIYIINHYKIDVDSQNIIKSIFVAPRERKQIIPLISYLLSIPSILFFVLFHILLFKFLSFISSLSAFEVFAEHRHMRIN